MTEDAWTYLFLCGSAFLAGVINSVAGGGTLLTFPTLTSVVSEAVANATSTVALAPGSLAGALGYRREVAKCRRFLARMLLPSLLGGALGAWLVYLDEKKFAVLVPWLILTAALLFVIQQPLGRWLKTHKPDHEPGPIAQAGLMIFQFGVAIYGGYFGAGIGILMLTALGFMGVRDIHQANAVKTCLAFVINGSAVVVFVANGLVEWKYALPMAGTAILGGYAGASVARRLPAVVVRSIVIVIGFGLAVYYFVK